MLVHWGKNGPPVSVAVAGYLGLLKTPTKKGTPSPQKGKASSPPGDLNELVRKFQSTGGMIH